MATTSNNDTVTKTVTIEVPRVDDESDKVVVVSLPYGKYQELREILDMLDGGNTQVLKKVIEREKALTFTGKFVISIVGAFAAFILAYNTIWQWAQGFIKGAS